MNFLADSFGDANNPGVPMLILGVGGIVVMYVVLRPLMRRKNDPFSKPFQTTSLSQQRSVERQMETLLVELSDMSRQMTAQLDTRAAKLEALIQEADVKIAELKTLAQREAIAPQRFAMSLPSVEMPPSEPAREPEREPERVPEQHAAVYRLADAGKSSGQIASELQRPSGEIELILALRSRG